MKLSQLEKMVVLGLLLEGSQHGYRLRQVIRKKFGQFTGFSPRAIYYTLSQLEKTALVSRQITRTGKRPEKSIYTITEKGRQEFLRLMELNLLDPYRPFFNVDLALYFLPYLQPDWLKEKIKAIQRNWRAVRVWARKQAKKEKWPYQLIFLHLEKALEAEIYFLQQILRL